MVKRFIVKFADTNNKIKIVVIKALTEYRAISKCLSQYSDSKKIITIRELYNPILSPRDGWFFKKEKIPYEYRVKYAQEDIDFGPRETKFDIL